jgi:hypothetical protein
MKAFSELGAVRPRIGKGQVIHVLEAYQNGYGLQDIQNVGSLSATLTGFSRKTAMMPVISDFLFDEAPEFLKELRQVNGVHDVFIMIVDASFAFELPKVSAGWVEVYDVETGRTRMMSRRELGQAERARQGVAGRNRAPGQGERSRRHSPVRGSSEVRRGVNRMGC